MGDVRFFFRDDRVDGVTKTNYVTGAWNSLWRCQGQPSHGALPPTTHVAPTRTTAGAIRQSNPTNPNKLWFLSGYVSGTAALGTVLVYDRLLHGSGLSGTSVSSQTVGGSLTRYETADLCSGNRIWLEIYSTLGASGTTATVNYINQDGANTNTTCSIGGTGSRETELMIDVPLAPGDYGVRGVNSVTLTGTTGTAGDFGVTIGRPICRLPCVGVGRDVVRNLFIEPPLREVLTDACIALAFATRAVTLQQLFGALHFMEA